MKLKIDAEADALYLHLDDSRIVESEEVSPGIVVDLNDENVFRRNVHFSGIRPNFVLQVSRLTPQPITGTIDCNNPLNTIDSGQFQSAYAQDGVNAGAFEVAIPWSLLGDFV